MSITPFQQLSSILQAEIDVASKLYQLLQNEQQALKSADVEQIGNVAKQKQPLVVRLQQMTRQREQVLSLAGFPADKSGMNAFIANQSEVDASKLQILLSRLAAVAKSCRLNNQVNGGIINVNHQYLNKALSILRGRDPETTSYGPGGQYASQVVRQPLLGRV